jgi:hypothetical protein
VHRSDTIGRPSLSEHRGDFPAALSVLADGRQEFGDGIVADRLRHQIDSGRLNRLALARVTDLDQLSTGSAYELQEFGLMTDPDLGHLIGHDDRLGIDRVLAPLDPLQESLDRHGMVNPSILQRG